MERKGNLYNFNQILFFGFLLFGGLYLAQTFLIPVFIAALLSMLLLPVCKRLEKWGFKRVWAIISCILLLLMLLGGLAYLFINQVGSFSDDLPGLREKFNEHLANIKNSLAESTELSREQIREQISSSISRITESLGSYVQSALTVTAGFLINFFLILIYIGFFLAYREMLEKFILKLAKEEERDRAEEIIKDCTSMSISYLSGILMVMFILAVCNTAALTIIGIEHAVFFAVLAAILNLIPFVGTVSGSILPMFMALLTKDSIWYVVAVGAYFTVIQYIESYFLTPFIVGGKVRVNPLAEILALVLGGVLWGIAGMVLFIPLIGLVKVLFDHFKRLEPYAYVIGREDSQSDFANKIKNWFKDKFGNNPN
jgi:predicted PurR-regulated permease PerM